MLSVGRGMTQGQKVASIVSFIQVCCVASLECPLRLTNLGTKEVKADAAVWVTFTQLQGGRPEDRLKDSKFASGFQWSCCKAPLDEEGCIEEAEYELMTKRFRRN